MTEPGDETARRIEEIAAVLRKAVTESLDEVLDRRLEPFLLRTQRMLLETSEQLIEKRAGPFLHDARDVVVGTAHLIREKELQPFLEETRRMLTGTVDEVVRKHAEPLVLGTRKVFEETTVGLLRDHAPEYGRRAGRRAISYAVAGTLLCVAVVFLFIGGILALKDAGIPPYATYLAGGSLAALLGGALLKWRSRIYEKTIPDPTKPGNGTPAA